MRGGMINSPFSLDSLGSVMTGSGPGRQGFFMAVNANGEMAGSIGGGIMEHKFVELAKEKLSDKRTRSQIKKQLHDKSAAKDRSGMICSGEQTVLIYPVSREDEEVISAIIKCLEKNKTSFFTAIISAAILIAISSGVWLLMEIPTGE